MDDASEGVGSGPWRGPHERDGGSATLGMTAEELFELPEDHLRHELVEGELRPMAPAGGRHGWGVDPQGRLAAVHHPGGLVTVLREDGALDGEDVLPGFRLPLSLLFA